MYCETGILKDVIITDAKCSTNPFFYELSNGIRRVNKVVYSLVFYIHSIGTFYYITENSIEIKEIMEGIKNKKHFTIKYKKSSHKVVEIISETNIQNDKQPVFPEQDLEKTDLIKQLAKCSDRIKELEKILCLSKFQDFMNEIPNITSPCKICNNYNNETYDTTKCIDCCYYYGSQFEIKEIK